MKQMRNYKKTYQSLEYSYETRADQKHWTSANETMYEYIEAAMYCLNVSMIHFPTTEFIKGFDKIHLYMYTK